MSVLFVISAIIVGILNIVINVRSYLRQRELSNPARKMSVAEIGKLTSILGIVFAILLTLGVLV